MRPDAEDALEEWERAFKEQQDQAVRAAGVAFPLLGEMAYPTGCCDLRMQWSKDGLGSGTVCIDDQARSTLDFQGLPHQSTGEAIDVLMGPGWFEEAPNGIAKAGPGTYWWNDEDCGGEWEIKVTADGHLDMTMDFMRVPDVLAVLDTLYTALTAA